MMRRPSRVACGGSPTVREGWTWRLRPPSRSGYRHKPYAESQTDLIGNRLISQHPKLRAVFQAGVRQNLDHKNADQFFLRIDPESRAGRAAPVVFTRRAHHPGFTRRFTDREAEAEPGSRPHPGNGSQVV